MVTRTSSTRRRLVLVVLLLAGGSFVNMLVAWGIQWSYHDYGWFYAKDWQEDLGEGWLWSVYEYDRPNQTRLVSVVRMAPAYGVDDTPFSSLPEWEIITDRHPHTRSPGGESIVQERVGFPMESLWSARTSGFSTTSDTVVGGWIMGSSPGGHGCSGVMLSYRPLLLGFTLNTLFYAVLLVGPWIIWRASYPWRYARRQTVGRCPHCRYRLRELTRCPECGWGRTDQSRDCQGASR